MFCGVVKRGTELGRTRNSTGIVNIIFVSMVLGMKHSSNSYEYRVFHDRVLKVYINMHREVGLILLVAHY